MGLAPHPTESTAGNSAQLAQVFRAQVGNRMMLEIAPEVLDRIEFGSVCREPFDFEPVAMLLDELGNLPAPVHGQAVPDHQQGSRQLAQETAEKVDQLWSADRSWVQAEVEVPPGYPRDRRERLPVEVELEDGRMAAGSPGPAAMGSLAESAFIDEDDGLAPSGSVFFTLGHCTRFHCSMLSSLRSTARPTGRCTLHFSRLRIFQTCPG